MSEELMRFDKTKSLVFIDCETLNLCLNFCQNLPWQVAMIKTVGGRKTDERDFLIKWDTELKISEEAKRITNYPEAKILSHGKKFEDVFPEIEDWLESSDYILGHNTLQFDIYLIKEMYALKGKKMNHLVHKFIDTNCLAKGIKYGIQKMENEPLIEYQYKLSHTRRKGIKTNLQALGKDYSIEHDYDNLHNAIVDLELNLKVWNKIKFQIDI